jgi:uncharacterized protein
MAATTVIPLHAAGQPFYAPAFQVRLRGETLPPEVVRDVIEVTYEDNVEKVDSFTLVVNNWNSLERHPKFLGQGAFPRLWNLVQPGNEMELLLGYQGRSPDMRLMTSGYVTTLEADFPEGGAPRLTVRGLNVLDRLRGKQYTWGWPEGKAVGITDSEIARDLGRKPDQPEGRPGLGIKVKVDPEAARQEPVVPSVLMNNEYPIVFLMRRARARGYDVFITREPGSDEPVLYFGPSRRVRDRTYELAWGKSLTSAKVTISTARQVKTVTVLGWDRKTKKQIKGVAKIEDQAGVPPSVKEFALRNGREEVVTDHPVPDEAEAKKHAAELLVRQSLEQIQVTGAVVGLPDLRAGRVAMLAGLGPILDGRYFVTETAHVLGDNGYRTTFKARREDDRTGVA